MADLQKLQFNNRTILVPNRDAYVAFLPDATSYKRFMWRFDGNVGSSAGFQMSRIKINSETLPYTYVTYGANFSNWSNTQIPQ